MTGNEQIVCLVCPYLSPCFPPLLGLTKTSRGWVPSIVVIWMRRSQKKTISAGWREATAGVVAGTSHFSSLISTAYGALKRKYLSPRTPKDTGSLTVWLTARSSTNKQLSFGSGNLIGWLTYEPFFFSISNVIPEIIYLCCWDSWHSKYICHIHVYFSIINLLYFISNKKEVHFKHVCFYI